MAEELNDPAVRKHIAGVTGQGADGPAKRYEVHHRDAKSRAGARHTALTKLAAADPENPVGISNVGIFGEGIDTPDLAAIAFIEPRKGPIDVIQAVGRVMRRSKAKDIGLILVPLEIPPDEDAEAWLESRTSEKPVQGARDRSCRRSELTTRASRTGCSTCCESTSPPGTAAPRRPATTCSRPASPRA